MTVAELLDRLKLCDPAGIVTVAYPDPEMKGTDYESHFREADWFDVQGCGKQIVIGYLGGEGL